MTREIISEEEIEERIWKAAAHLVLEGPCFVDDLTDIYGISMEILVHYLGHLMLYPNLSVVEEPLMCALKDEHRAEVLLKYV